MPPSPPANLLVPADGQAFGPGAPVSLQWVSVGELRPGEAYQISIEDVTCQCARAWTAVVADTRYALPADYQPQDERPHVYRWSVIPVRIRAGARLLMPAFGSFTGGLNVLDEAISGLFDQGFSAFVLGETRVVRFPHRVLAPEPAAHRYRLGHRLD